MYESVGFAEGEVIDEGLIEEGIPGIRHVRQIHDE